ncbi:hypothetical protein N3K63_13740 [Microbacterium sp. W1N]|uniref:hypothetical protein n=1 Tax=Microbacterium festucae TaxID=2977531 RepID=UPI0021BEC0BC|nr:hypothetical protein [Microbacterium festucae]MCT9821343.1 hypothetical protein [Microbacterium festucae]
MSRPGFTASWPTLTAWGTGLVQLALGAGVITGDLGVGPRAAGVLLLTTGALTVVAGVAWLARGLRGPRLALGVAVAGIAAMALALIADPAGVSVLAVAVGIALSVILAVTAVGLHRRRGGAQPEVRRPGVSGLLVAAVLVAGGVTPALASTEAGRLAPDHSEHTLVIDHHH